MMMQQAQIEDYLVSWENYCRLFDALLDCSDTNFVITESWAFDLIHEFVYQFQSFCQLRGQVGRVSICRLCGGPLATVQVHGSDFFLTGCALCAPRPSIWCCWCVFPLPFFFMDWFLACLAFFFLMVWTVPFYYYLAGMYDHMIISFPNFFVCSLITYITSSSQCGVCISLLLLQQGIILMAYYLGMYFFGCGVS